MISFGAYDDDVYDFMQSSKNASALVRMLVRAYMRGENASLPAQNTQPKNEVVITAEPKVTNESVVNEEKSTKDTGFDYSKCGSSEVVVTRTEDKNRKKIQELDL